MNDLLILGAGGTSREIAGAVADINRQQPRWNLLGFLDDDHGKQGTTIDGLPVLGPISSASGYDAELIIGIGRWNRLEARRLIVTQLGLPDRRYATVVHPSASVSPYAKIGVGTAVLQNVVIMSECIIGNHVLIGPAVSMAHDQVVQDFVTIAPAAVVTGGVRLLSGCYIGAGAVIMSGRTIGEEALVGLGSVVFGDVPPGRTVMGNPAQLLPGVPRG